ncbi:unnamed protein product [Paramecium primaurelia]|uniref:Uncharacterized protein n=1 Tax=Paramecium primaurelia TaxID=5886 RepID=A0A8S1N3E7_PARPR|nr:unnamed protein product [Paramecium primaurelia]
MDQKTNINGGCVTGYDGICVQSVLELNSLESAVCQPYKSCEKVFYITHEQCQQANRNCTTNGKTSCIDLTECQLYQSQVGCVINKTGLNVQSGIVKSTGLCTWDAKNNQCRDQDCSDYIRTTHRECFGILSTCTSNGETCIKQELCSSYTTQVICETAVGSDGICFWEYASLKNNNNATCRLLICQDIQNSLSNNVCLASSLSCVIDNDNICIPKANCSTYTSKSACNYGGLDGICVFKQQNGINSISGIGTCTLMRDCSAANDDQNACQAAKDRCLWIPELIIQGLATPSKCSALDCTLNWAKNGYCNRILNWDKTSQQICKLINGTCVAINPITLSSSECLKISGYTYTWNTSKNQCQVCKPSKPNSNQNNDTGEEEKNENTESTSSNQILSIIGLMVIDYLIS